VVAGLSGAERIKSCVADYPELMHTALDATDARALAEFYRQLLGLQYRPGDEEPSDDDDWLVLVDAGGKRKLAFQQVDTLPPSTWPADGVPMQLHLDFAVPTLDELERHKKRAEDLGATLLLDRTEEEGEPLYVLADPAGHPFCLVVSEG
jgi:catechol 2,3-dioxygenase-like lactoylglutathione lyase family enzyme